ncbi:MAG: hypothetical protein IPI42_06435 [Saprospiraceae bacterium]|nr:hypothetical protein [Candidatus Parvibacillus calidus]
MISTNDFMTWAMVSKPGEQNLITSLSNVTDNLYQSHRPGLDYRFQNKKTQSSAGVGYQYSILNTDKTFPTSGTCQ